MKLEKLLHQAGIVQQVVDTQKFIGLFLRDKALFNQFAQGGGLAIIHIGGTATGSSSHQFLFQRIVYQFENIGFFLRNYLLGNRLLQHFILTSCLFCRVKHCATHSAPRLNLSLPQRAHIVNYIPAPLLIQRRLE